MTVVSNKKPAVALRVAPKPAVKPAAPKPVAPGPAAKVLPAIAAGKKAATRAPETRPGETRKVAPAKMKAIRVPVRAAAPVAAIDIAVFRDRLLQKRDDIISMVKRDQRAGQEASDDTTDDIVDRANNAYHRELMFALSDGERGILLQVEEALKRVDAGTYGACVHCGAPIAPARLQALPWARYCIDCQELQEKGMLED